MKNLNSHLTAKEREEISFPARILIEKQLIKGDVLDFGCGFGKDVDTLNSRNIKVQGYDPFYYKEYPTQQFDTILCTYVLNVLLPQEQTKVIFQVSRLLKPGGSAFFAVRRDILNPGFRTHKIHKEKTYQCNVLLPFKSIYKNKYVEIYEYKHYCFINKGNSSISPFFADNEIKKQKGETATAFAILDKFPVSEGHSLIIPKRNVTDYFDLTFQEQSGCWFLINLVKQELKEKYNPSGFNIGLNINIAAGQTVSHCHIHLIPRYTGDVENPKGGIRGVIPNKKEY